METVDKIKRKWTSDEKTILVFSALLGSLFLFFCYKIIVHPWAILPARYPIIFAGIVFEYKRLVSWRQLLNISLGGFGISLIIFIPALGDGSFIDSLKVWPYFFGGAFAFFALILQMKALLPRITEGIVLLQTMAIIYWVLTTNTIEYNWFTVALIMVSVILGVIALYYAFSYAQHTRTSLLCLSIWSAIVLVLIGFDNASQVLAIGEIEHILSPTSVALTAAQYFMLGISCLYIADSFLMVYAFLPFRGKESRKEYEKARKELKDWHIARVDTRQLKRTHALAAVVFTIIVFGCNYTFRLLPPNFLIWLVFILFPVFIFFYDKLFPSGEPFDEVDKNSYYRNYKRFR
nr:hypothetical protein [uncultured Mucilaginibacter sp.]